MDNLFGNWLVERRLRYGLDQAQLARLAKLKPMMVCDIEKGRRGPSQANLEALAKVPELGVSLAELDRIARLAKAGIDLAPLESVRDLLRRILSLERFDAAEVEDALHAIEGIMGR